MNRVLVSLKGRTDPLLHPLLQVRPTRKELVLVISTDKGLAGALNTNLMREAATFEAEKTVYVSAGRKARQFLARTKRELLADFELKDAPTILETKEHFQILRREISHPGSGQGHRPLHAFR